MNANSKYCLCASFAVQELMTGDLLSTGGSLSSKQLQRMVTALNLASDKSAEISALEAELLQAKSKALLYEVQNGLVHTQTALLVTGRCKQGKQRKFCTGGRQNRSLCGRSSQGLLQSSPTGICVADPLAATLNEECHMCHIQQDSEDESE